MIIGFNSIWCWSDPLPPVRNEFRTERTEWNHHCLKLWSADTIYRYSMMNQSKSFFLLNFGRCIWRKYPAIFLFKKKCWSNGKRIDALPVCPIKCKNSTIYHFFRIFYRSFGHSSFAFCLTYAREGLVWSGGNKCDLRSSFLTEKKCESGVACVDQRHTNRTNG